IHDGQEQGGLPVGVRVHGALGEPGLARDPLQARRVIPALGEHRTGREDQGLARPSLAVPPGDGVGERCHVARLERSELLTEHPHPNPASTHIPSESEELPWTPTFCTSPAAPAATARSWPTTGSHFASVPGRWWACWATTAPARPRSYPRSSGC